MSRRESASSPSLGDERSHERALRLGRRTALEGAGAAGLVGAVLASVPVSARADAGGAAQGEPNDAPAWSLDPRARALRAHDLRPLSGQALSALRACEAAGVTLVEAFAPRHGGLPFVIEIRSGHPDVGARRAFELLRADVEGDVPLATVGGLALVMENRGDGQTPTSEHDARLALRLAAALAPHAAGLEGLELTTASARRTRAPFATLHVPTTPGDEAQPRAPVDR
jgi:hypothetical protein